MLRENVSKKLITMIIMAREIPNQYLYILLFILNGYCFAVLFCCLKHECLILLHRVTFTYLLKYFSDVIPL